MPKLVNTCKHTCIYYLLSVLNIKGLRQPIHVNVHRLLHLQFNDCLFLLCTMKLTSVLFFICEIQCRTNPSLADLLSMCRRHRHHHEVGKSRLHDNLFPGNYKLKAQISTLFNPQYMYIYLIHVDVYDNIFLQLNTKYISLFCK